MLSIGILVVGVLCVCYGIYTSVVRRNKPSAFGKLDAMKERLGQGVGLFVHVLFYTVLPIVFGLLLTITGLFLLL